MPSTNASAALPTLRALLSNLDVEGAATPTRRDRGGLDTGTTGSIGEGVPKLVHLVNQRS
jgi:hypothetical protein